LMDAGMDTGAMLLKSGLSIALLDNAYDLVAKLSPLGANLLIETLPKLVNQDIQPTSQDDRQATYAPLIKKENYELDWSRGAIALHNQIRGFYPNCTTSFRGTVLKIMATVPMTSTIQLPSEFASLQSIASEASIRTSGEVAAIVKNLGAVIQTGEGLLFLREAQLAGKRPQSGWDFANGSRLEVGEVLGQGEERMAEA
jgi:methionyl-tRNA formyltransferase